ncbi:MAG TPA: hypothetical protein VE133_15500 [Candidatus Sulfotelmatobacter sp.]|nr:hypothetical protein [Candidatus Sulfotelmatobacter sp.]
MVTVFEAGVPNFFGERALLPDFLPADLFLLLADMRLSAEKSF